MMHSCPLFAVHFLEVVWPQQFAHSPALLGFGALPL
jgi:hypothetical protein